MNYDIQIIAEFNIGEVKFPFLFSLNKVKGFPRQNPMSENVKYKTDFLKLTFKERLLQYLYMDYLDLELDEEFLDDFTINTDYKFEHNKLVILSPNFFYNMLMSMEGVTLETLQELRAFIDNYEIKIMTTFLNRVIEDLNYNDKKDMMGNNNTHTLLSLLGDTSVNPTPFFPENLDRAIYDWSWREIQLRTIYRSKTFSIENAIKAEQNRLQEQALAEAKANRK